ncbi:HIV Tat-specific factor 1 [Sporothrix schenckii 1099-18]|uniref:HIV Tat-specific factor 1 n=1 Tax=Sporothrix schenckii 1099-18 TaxID=1397361 RepID=A0A0F2M574_SPOSC|nr:HIV Tat-specific factor 1 [Sporothrix schenckii 1099-18]KJR84777.1 HIV Tat-specific factor 1 [Sporothrix schenckii 1099-18]
MADQGVGQIWTFPTDISQFDDDERISYSRLDRKYIAVQDDGTEFEFDQSLRRWIPLADNDDADEGSAIDAFAAAHQQESSASESRKRKPDHSYYNSETYKKQEHAIGDFTVPGEKLTTFALLFRLGFCLDFVLLYAPCFPHVQPRDTSQNQDRHPNGRRGGHNGNNSNNNDNDTTTGSSNKRAKAQAGPRQPKQNTAVYVTGLPSDATADEVAELFSRKCGVIAEEIDSGRPRIKMYTNSDGSFKGDALIVFFKPQSVDMAIMLLDDTDFRFAPTPGSADAGRMHVQAADSSYKKTNYQQQSESSTPAEGGTPGDGAASAAASAVATDGGGQPGSSASAPTGGSGKNAHQDKQKIIKKTQKLDAKLADWSSDEDERFAGLTGGGGGNNNGSSRNRKWDKVVVLKHMFTLAELDEDPAALLDIKEDIREECSKLGDVTNVVLFDQEAAGVVSVKFKTAEAAAACVRLMGGRAFDGRIVEATLATGREKYRKSKKGDDDEGKGSSDEEDD